MVVILYSIVFGIAFLIRRAYRHCRKYYATILYVSATALLYTLICRGYLLWRFPSWWIFNDKTLNLVQAALLLPCSTVLYLHYYSGHKWRRILCFVLFWGLYVVYELLLIWCHGIIYDHGWRFGWSVFIDFSMFVLVTVHARRRRTAIIISACIIVFLVLWFRVPVFRN